MAFCTKCGAQNNGTFCTNCGAPMGAAASGPVAPPPGPPMSAPPMAPPPGVAPVKKTSPLVWVIVGIVGFLILCVIGVSLAGYFFARKVSKYAKDPAAAVAAMASLNPDVEVLSKDGSGKLTVRDKKTGKIVTMDFDELQKGNLRIKSDDGTVELGTGSSAKLPDWVPNYPGSTPQGTFAANSNEGQGGMASFKTKDSIKDVISFYDNALKQGGYEITSTSSGSSGGSSSGTITGENKSDNRTVMVVASAEGSETNVVINYGQKR